MAMRKFPRDDGSDAESTYRHDVAASSSCTVVVRITFAILLAAVRLMSNAVDPQIRSTFIIERANR